MLINASQGEAAVYKKICISLFLDHQKNKYIRSVYKSQLGFIFRKHSCVDCLILSVITIQYCISIVLNELSRQRLESVCNLTP